MPVAYLTHQVAGQSVKRRSPTRQNERHVLHPPQEAPQMVWPREENEPKPHPHRSPVL